MSNLVKYLGAAYDPIVQLAQKLSIALVHGKIEFILVLRDIAEDVH